MTQSFEKHILDNCKNEYQFKSIIDDLTLYSDYSLLNTLLIRSQYPNFLSLGTKKYYKDKGVDLLDTAIPIKVLKPINENFVSIKKDDKEITKSINDLNKTELSKYYDKDNQDIVFHHNEFKGLRSIELYDVKDTTTDKLDYDQGPLPALFFSTYDESYNKEKSRIIEYFYSQLLCEIIRIRWELCYENICKKDLLEELPDLRNFKSDEIVRIYKNAIQLLEVKHRIVVTNDNPLKAERILTKNHLQEL